MSLHRDVWTSSLTARTHLYMPAGHSTRRLCRSTVTQPATAAARSGVCWRSPFYQGALMTSIAVLALKHSLGSPASQQHKSVQLHVAAGNACRSIAPAARCAFRLPQALPSALTRLFTALPAARFAREHSPLHRTCRRHQAVLRQVLVHAVYTHAFLIVLSSAFHVLHHG